MIEGPARIQLARQTYLDLPAGLVFLPPAEGTEGEVLGVVVDQAAQPHELVLFAASRDERGVPDVEAFGWRE